MLPDSSRRICSGLGKFLFCSRTRDDMGHLAVQGWGGVFQLSNRSTASLRPSRSPRFKSSNVQQFNRSTKERNFHVSIREFKNLETSGEPRKMREGLNRFEIQKSQRIGRKENASTLKLKAYGTVRAPYLRFGEMSITASRSV